MLVKQEQTSPCEVELKVEVDAEKVGSAVDATYAEFGKRVNIPGFRKGKAPRPILERYIDEEKVKDHVADKLLEPAFKEALEESRLEPYAPADVHLEKFDFGEPLLFTAKVPLRPVVELGEYIGLEIERTLREVKDEDVDAEIQQMLDRHAQRSVVTGRPVQAGDILRVEISDDDKPGEAPTRNVAEVGDNLPDFDAGLIGMNADEEKVIQVTYPEDFQAEDLRGKTVPLRTKLIEIQEKKVPELTDEWVKDTFSHEPEEGQEPDEGVVDTVDKLRAAIRKEMERAASDVADAEVRNKLIDKVVDSSTVSFPQFMLKDTVKDQVQEMTRDLKKRKLTLDDYMKHRKITAEELQSELEESASETLNSLLVLREIAEKENIGVNDEDVDAEVAYRARKLNMPVESVEAVLDRTDGRRDIRNRILHKKLVDFLVHASNIKNVGHRKESV